MLYGRSNGLQAPTAVTARWPVVGAYPRGPGEAPAELQKMMQADCAGPQRVSQREWFSASETITDIPTVRDGSVAFTNNLLEVLLGATRIW